MYKLPKLDYPEIILLNAIDRDYFRIRLSCHSQHKYTTFYYKDNKVLVSCTEFNDWIEKLTVIYTYNDFDRFVNRKDIYTFILNANLRGIEVLNKISDYSELTEDEKNTLNGLKRYDNEKLMEFYEENLTEDEFIESIRKIGTDTFMDDFIIVGTDAFKIKGIDSFKNIL